MGLGMCSLGTLSIVTAQKIAIVHLAYFVSYRKKLLFNNIDDYVILA